MPIIKLGLPGALRSYSLTQSPNVQLLREQANPMATRVNTSGEFDVEDAWEAWTMNNWQAGVGKKDPMSGGFLYSDCDTRFNNQLFLPPQVQTYGAITSFYSVLWDEDEFPVTTLIPDDTAKALTKISGTVTLGAGQTYTKVGGATAIVSGTVNGVYIYLQSSTVSHTVWVYTSPNEVLDEANIQTSVDFVPDAGAPGWYWFYVPFDSPYVHDGDGGGEAVGPTDPDNDTIEVALAFINDPSGFEDSAAYNGTSWVSDALTVNGLGVAPMMYMDHPSNLLGTPGTATNGVDIREFNSNLYAAFYRSIYKATIGSTNKYFNAVGSTGITANITDMHVWNGELFIAQGSGANARAMNTSEVFSDAGFTAELLHSDGNFLWRSLGSNLYYSADGNTWSSAIPVGPSDYSITSILAAAGGVYVTTNEGLYEIAPSDKPVALERFDSIDADNGKGSVEHEGALFIPVGNQILRFDPSGGAQNIWWSGTHDFPSHRIGKIEGLTTAWGGVWALLNPENDNQSTVWAWNGQGWHHILTAPNTADVLGGYYDRRRSSVWFWTDAGIVYHLFVPKENINPTKDPHKPEASYGNSYFMPSGWLEMDKFWGGSRVLQKDWESVTVWGQNLDSENRVSVYWQDQASTDWELLGTVTSDGQELRWSDPDTRPNSQWIKIGLLLESIGENSATVTPVVEAAVTKFLPMLNDRFRWNVAIPVFDNQQMPDGEKNDFTAAEMRTHLDSIINRVPPVIFQDEYGDRWEVKVTGHKRNVARYDHVNGENLVQSIYNLTLEQVSEGQYNG